MYYDNKDLSVNALHYKYKISYSTLHEMKKTFIEHEWVIIENKNKKHIVSVTQKGEEIVKRIYDIMTLLGLVKEDVFALKLNRKRKQVNENEKDTKEIINEENTTDIERNKDNTGDEPETEYNDVARTEPSI
jgi:predicted transcriptional regulator